MQHEQRERYEQPEQPEQQTEEQPVYGRWPGKDSTSGPKDYHAVKTYPFAPGNVVEDNWYIPGPETGKGPKNYFRSDEVIRDAICARLTQHGSLDARDIEVDIQNGVVTLRGTVPSPRAKRTAERTAYFVAGVKDVHNKLTIEKEQQGQPPRAGEQAAH